VMVGKGSLQPPCCVSIPLYQAWSQFGGSLDELQQLSCRGRAVQCLNLLVTNALQHVPDVLTYMSRIHNQSIFNFCAIPQVHGVGLWFGVWLEVCMWGVVWVIHLAGMVVGEWVKVVTIHTRCLDGDRQCVIGSWLYPCMSKL